MDPRRRISAGGVRDPIEKQEPIKEHQRIVKYQSAIIDQGVSDKRALMTESEFSSALRVMNREGNTLSATLRDAWDTGHLRTLTKNNAAVATGAHISIVGHITKMELLREMTSADNANGSSGRWFGAPRYCRKAATLTK